jgi:hypothetical protein
MSSYVDTIIFGINQYLGNKECFIILRSKVG